MFHLFRPLSVLYPGPQNPTPCEYMCASVGQKWLNDGQFPSGEKIYIIGVGLEMDRGI